MIMKLDDALRTAYEAKRPELLEWWLRDLPPGCDRGTAAKELDELMGGLNAALVNGAAGT